ncbi:pitrilysin family protein [Novosphingobium sp. TH158]|uniref:M16 family metallopeptidase n=1 Tax=Novosphingobium sp. TH158 TaxID=2067455 RepID=UPI000C7AD6A6|nr:M16 family metallopeptidase [Novosphingobium sp. TH158]PLK26056.1 peptidase M16 [Novosphingobium sp. TH158]
MRRILLLIAALPSLLLAACAPQQQGLSSSPPPPHRPRSEWAMNWSNVPVDPGYRFGRLANGMRYVIRQNATPKGTAAVRMEVNAGSLDESDSERGFAHFVEHMSFNGSTNVPEGEMVKLLEREGLAFGADTNASTNYTETHYMLDLPRNDPKLLETALMLMRETASELKFDPAAVDRERGVILSEMRDRNTWQLRNYSSQAEFTYPKAHYVRRLPIGTTETLTAATAGALKAFWAREYVPEQTTIIVVGDFDPDLVEGTIRKRFDDWKAAPSPVDPQPSAGPLDLKDKGRTAVYIDQALSERVTITRSGKWRNEADSIEERNARLLRSVGYAIVNRRLLRISRQAAPPYRGASFGTGAVFREARATNLVVDTVDGKWRTGMLAAAAEYRLALAHGFTAAEVNEQIANLRNDWRNAAASQDTRHHRSYLDALLSLIRDERVPATPQSTLERIEAFIPQITPERVLAALREDALELKDPLIRFSGRKEPVGGAKAIRDTWNQAMRSPVKASGMQEATAWGYSDFGTPGTIASDSTEPVLGIRTLRFANGVRLNLKRTDLEKDRVLIQVSVDGGSMLNTRENPLATEMAGNLQAGGLGKHSADDLQTILAGRSVGGSFGSTPETFVASAGTTPKDLELQMQVFAAMITDPGYRLEGQTLYYNAMNTFFARLRSTPGDALRNSAGGILSDNDPRFTLQPISAYRALSFKKLKADISERLAKGAIEIGVVGDFQEDAAIAAVARTFGALAPREPEFQPYAERRTRPFTADRSLRVLRHDGPKDQAIVRMTWPTRDGEDPVETVRFALLEQVFQNMLTENLREALGKAYSPGVGAELSRVWRGYGTFTISSSANVTDVPAVRRAMLQALASLRDAPISADQLQRARAPMLESFDNALKRNGGWLALVDRAQTESDRIDRHVKGKERLAAITAADLRALARRYLVPGGAVEFNVLPEGVDPPAQ